MMNQGGGVMMMSGVAVMAMLAQMFLGKVAFLAGSALLIAKIALLFSTLVFNLIHSFKQIRITLKFNEFILNC